VLTRLFSLLVVICVFSVSFSCAEVDSGYPKMTERYLDEVGYDKIAQQYSYTSFSHHISLLLDVADQEQSMPVFGYHGSSQQYRIFQDVLRAVFEESLGFDIPENFQFLRIPGDDSFDLKDGVQSYYEMFGRKLTEDNLDRLSDLFILKPLREQMNLPIYLDRLDSEQRHVFGQLFIDFAKYLDYLDGEGRTDELWHDEFSVAKMSIESQSKDGTNKGGGMRKEMELKIRDYMMKENQNLDPVSSGISKDEKGLKYTNQVPEMVNLISEFCESVDKKELENWLVKNLSMKLIFERFWGLWGVEVGFNVDQFLFPYLDTRPEQQKLLVCMNVPMFGNYFRWDESSVLIFLNGFTIESGDNYVKTELKKFFKEIGIPETVVSELFTLAQEELYKNHVYNGCIYQFVDLNHDSYQLSNTYSYVSRDFGIPVQNLKPYDLISGSYPIHQKGIDLQLRLVMSNYTTLNPYSSLRIMRYDTLDQAVSQEIISKMKNRLRKEGQDLPKIQYYREKMQRIWDL